MVSYNRGRHKLTGILITSCAVLVIIALYALYLAINLNAYVDNQREYINQLESKIEKYNEQLDTIADSFDELVETYELLKIDYTDLKDKLLIYKTAVPKEIVDHVSRGNNIRTTQMDITAYDLSYESCGKYPDHPQYGITASGVGVTDWQTIAVGPNIPFGTKIYIPYFKDKPNGGIFTVEDRGGAIGNNNIDVFIRNREDALRFGRRRLEVHILK